MKQKQINETTKHEKLEDIKIKMQINAVNHVNHQHFELTEALILHRLEANECDEAMLIGQKY